MTVRQFTHQKNTRKNSGVVIKSAKQSARYTAAKTAAVIFAFCFLFAKDAASQIGQSGVITLSMPVGARPTAMGEAFTAIADDANAIFYNPAGLGLSPLTLAWKTHFADSAFTSVAARSSTEFGARNYVWAGSGRGLNRWNGKFWERGEVYLPEENEGLRSVALRYFTTDDRATIDNAIWEIRVANNLGMKRYERLIELLENEAQLFANDSANFEPKSFARMLMLLPAGESVASNIEANVLPQSISQENRKRVADEIVNALTSEDRVISNFTELTIPFTIAVRDSVTTLTLDASERLWVGTVNGLWRYHNNRWTKFTTDDGLPSNRITSIAVASNGNTAVGTETGLALWSSQKQEWETYNDESGLPDSYITTLSYAANNRLYIGTPQGLALLRHNNIDRSQNELAIFDTTSGLLSLGVTALFTDSKGRLWVGGENGVSIHSDGRNWRRYRFPGSIVYTISEHQSGTIWLGTNKGVITHKAGVGEEPEWRTYHSKNALRNDNIHAIAASGKDMWVATDGAMHQHAYAETQVMIFYEQIMPAFKMNDLWHGFPAVVIPTEDWGTFGLSINFLNMGDHEMWSEVEEYLGKARAWEAVFGLSYGFPVKEDLALGINAKYIYSVLDNASGSVGQTFAIDVGVLKRNFLIDKFDIGFMLQNMGPSIYYMTPEESDPIPFTLRLGLAYRPIQTPFHELNLVLDIYREVVKAYEDKSPDPFWTALWTGMLNNKDTKPAEEFQAINWSTGLEYLYADFMALRGGFLFDYLGERFELSMGLGIKYANMNIDFSYIHAPHNFMSGFVRMFDDNKDGANGARDGQWRVSFLFKM